MPYKFPFEVGLRPRQVLSNPRGEGKINYRLRTATQSHASQQSAERGSKTILGRKNKNGTDAMKLHKTDMKYPIRV